MAIIRISPHFIVLGNCKSIEVIANGTSNKFSYIHEYKCKSEEERLDYALFSPSFSHFAALYSDKTVVIWKVKDKISGFEEHKVIEVNRRSTSLVFSTDEKEIFVADKSGDLYSFNLKGSGVKVANNEDTSEDEGAILGHVSMLLDVVCTDQYIITADRDEKIRVSNRRNPFIIELFCFGHTDFVSRLCLLSDKLLLSLSGDGTARLWEINTGALLQTVQIEQQSGKTENSEEPTEKQIPSIVAKSMNTVAIGCLKQSHINLYKLKDNLLHFMYALQLPEDSELMDFDFLRNGGLSPTVYILYKNQSLPYVTGFACTPESQNELQIESLSDFLKEIPGKDFVVKSYIPLYKPQMGGKKYLAFYKKKEEGKVFSKGTTTKKIKLEG